MLCLPHRLSGSSELTTFLDLVVYLSFPHQAALATLVSASKANFADKYSEVSKHWGGGLRGNKSIHMLRLRAKAAGQDQKTVSTTL